MKSVAFLFAVAVSTLANPVEKQTDVTKEDIENLINDFLRISNEKSSPVSDKFFNELHLESDNAKFNITFEDDVKYGNGILGICLKSVDLSKNSLEIKAGLSWTGTGVMGNASVVGTVNDKEINDNIELIIDAGALSNDNQFHLNFDENSVILDQYEIGDVTISGSKVKTSELKNSNVTNLELEKAVEESFKEYLLQLTTKIANHARSYLKDSEAVLKSKNLSQHVNTIKTEFRNKLA